MTSDLKILQALVKKQATVSPKSTAHGKKIITLKESADGSQYAVEIKGLPEDTIAIKADMFPAPDHIFTCKRGECRRADYILITNSDRGNFILYIEIKKGRAKDKEIIEQLKGHSALSPIVVRLAVSFGGKRIFLERGIRAVLSPLRKSASTNVRP